MSRQTIKDAIEAETGICISPQRENLLNIYYSELIKLGEKINLCGELDERIFWLKHIADSWLPHKCFSGNENVVDIGSGAGFPGLPLKILYPGINLTIIEKNYKKTIFLKSLLEKIVLSGYVIINKKFDGDLKLFNQKYDIILLRALKVSKKMAEDLKSITRAGGRIFLYNGPESESALCLLGGGWRIIRVVVGKIPMFSHQREVSIFEDVSRGTSSC